MSISEPILENVECGFQDTNGVFVDLKADSPTSNTLGTGKKGLTGLVGSMMSNIGKWLREARSYEITGGGILLSAMFLTGLLVSSFVVRYERSHNDIWLGQKCYESVGLAELPNEKGVYIPIYKERR